MNNNGSVVFFFFIGFLTIVSGAGIRNRENVDQQICPHCMREGHDTNADKCKFCGNKL
ncbi:hypothetical protein CLV51_10875 [Chitinophaga niastensis]|uniref:Uncharacterized protein n=1 Tax=Chitinophaga niastensis TaxID=536980 RepID=A0A2P8HAX7_CHINA|nr:hypothetical protein CLV51_10875 [Chitinophaga niastensis]